MTVWNVRVWSDISSKYDGEYFKENTGHSFSNIISGHLSGATGIACFISLKKVVIIQKKSCKFVILLHGVPLSEFEGSQ